MSDLATIKVHLEVLNLSTTRDPTMKEYKKAYRDLMKLHPGLGGDTTRFQEITLAAREVFEFLRRNQNKAPNIDTDGDSDLLEAFKASNSVNYNQGNIVFEIKAAEADLWVECLSKRLGKPLALESGNSLHFKIEEFRIPRSNSTTKTNYGSVTVTIWPRPKTTQPKIMVQGKCYLAFVTFIVPLVLKDIKNAQKPAITDTGKSLELHDSTDDELDKAEKSSKEPETASVTKALGRLENEVLTMRNDMAGRLETALKGGGGVANENLDKRLDGLENLLKVNVEQNKKLAQSIDKLTDTLENVGKASPVHLDSNQLHNLAREISESQDSQISALSSTVSSMRSEMIQAAALTSVEGKVDTLSSMLGQVHSTALKLRSEISDVKEVFNKVTDVTNMEMVQLRKTLAIA